jgi:uncharacterized protein
VPLYLDASALVAIIALEPTYAAVRAAVGADPTVPVVTDFARAEASAALMRLMRIQTLSGVHASEALERLDVWALKVAVLDKINSDDMEAAIRFVRFPELSLRAPDAIHIAAAHRLGATLLTLDRGMARAAAALGVSYLNPAEADTPGEQKD